MKRPVKLAMSFLVAFFLTVPFFPAAKKSADEVASTMINLIFEDRAQPALMVKIRRELPLTKFAGQPRAAA